MTPFDFVQYDAQADKEQNDLRSIFNMLYNIVQGMEVGFNKDQSLQKLEETYFWLGKSIRDSQLKRMGQ